MSFGVALGTQMVHVLVLGFKMCSILSKCRLLLLSQPRDFMLHLSQLVVQIRLT